MIIHCESTFHTLKEFFNFGIRPLLPSPVKKFYRMLRRSKNEGNTFNITDAQINNVKRELKDFNTRLFHRQNLLKLIYFSNTGEGVYYYRKHLYLGHGLKFVMPFYSKAMIEFFWNLPIRQLNKPDKYRWLQRQALGLAGLKAIAGRTTKTEFQALFSTGINQKREQVAQIIKKSKPVFKSDFPHKNLLKKLESDAAIETDEAVAVNQYLLTALWWETS